MADIALQIQKRAPQDPVTPRSASVLSSYLEALDSVNISITLVFTIAY
jgi:hypothetical protein